MDNVHKLHTNDDTDPDETPQDTVQDSVQDVAQGIVHEPAERVDVDASEPVEAEVIEGEILSDEESAELDRRLANRGALVRRAVTGTQVATRAVVKVST